MSTRDLPVEELPADLVERWDRLALAQSAGSRPWPGVDLAVRRSRRRRVAGACSLAAASVLVIGAVLGGATPSSLHRLYSAPASKGTGPLKLSDFNGPVGGSLGHDTAWISAMRERWLKLGSGGGPKTPDSVKVLWAGDLNGLRYAVIMYRPQAVPGSARDLWAAAVVHGQAGAAAGTMTMETWGNAVNNKGLLGKPDWAFVPAHSKHATHPGLLFVVAPKAGGVKVATARRFSPTGRISSAWRPLEKQGGSVWVGELSDTEQQLKQFQIAGQQASPGGAAGGLDNTTGIDAKVAAMTPPDADHFAVTEATLATQGLGATPAELPVLVTGRPLTGKERLAAVLLRSPDGGYLYGITLSALSGKEPPKVSGLEVNAGAISRQAFGSPDTFLGAVELKTRSRGKPTPYYVVIAPATAVTVRSGDQTATVQNRLALLPASGSAPAPVQALDQNGTVLATVTPIAGQAAHEHWGR
jgi:hypothetical protein